MGQGVSAHEAKVVFGSNVVEDAMALGDCRTAAVIETMDCSVNMSLAMNIGNSDSVKLENVCLRLLNSAHALHVFKPLCI